MKDEVIDFGIGQPAPDILPLAEIRRATEHRLAQNDTGLLGYGPEQGDAGFLKALAAFLERGYGFPVAVDNLIATAGGSQALDLICTLFTRPGDTIFVEEPTYFLALHIFADHGLKMIGIPVGPDGLDLDVMEEKLRYHRPRLFYTIPTFHNPTGTTLSQAQRERLVALSQAHDFYIAADECYQLLDYTAAPPPPLAAWLEGGRVFSIGSFSKILAPGLRMGWVHADAAHIERLVHSGLIESAGALNHFVSTVVCSALELGLQDSYLTRLKAIYAARTARLDAALHAALPASVTYRRPHGGFFFWLTLPPSAAPAAFSAAAADLGVGFQPGERFSCSGGLQQHIRLSFAYYDEAAIDRGVERLAAALARAGVG